jgi:glutamate/tyrosine decarboxylase-like PLP-dependent enzyme
VSDQSKHPADALDPTDWDEFRQLAYRVVDRMIDHLASIRDQPVWQPMPGDIRESFRTSLPDGGIGENNALHAFFDRVLPYSNGNQHPRFWGYVQGTGIPLAALSDFIASMMNAHLAGFDQAPAQVEEQVIAWLAQLLGFPKSTRGLLTSGGTMAGILALAVARHAKADGDIRSEGVSACQPMRVYASTETHHWLVRAVELLGLGRSSISWIDVDADFRINLLSLEQSIQRHRQQGIRPLAIVANVGTVQTGAIDPIGSLAGIASRSDVWLHVDGAFGALAKLSTKLAPLVAGIERADSIAFDLHKWMYLPFESACVLVRDGDLQRQAFVIDAPYLTATKRGVAAGGTPLADRGIELSRSFKALKVWLSLLAYGSQPFACGIERNVEQARHLCQRVENSTELELLAPTSLNIVCFRYRGTYRDEASLDMINEEILYRIQESGLAVVSPTRVAGKYALRAAIVNHRTRTNDLDLLVDRVLFEAKRLTQTLADSDEKEPT